MSTMPRIETHLYNAPTDRNKECPMSLGILNLTKREADEIAKLASALNAQRDAVGLLPKGATGPEMNSREMQALRSRGYSPEEMREIIARRKASGFGYVCANGHPLETDTSYCMECDRRELPQSRRPSTLRPSDFASNKDRERWLSGNWDEPNDIPSPQMTQAEFEQARKLLEAAEAEEIVNRARDEALTKPAVERNRFSGLDIG